MLTMFLKRRINRRPTDETAVYVTPFFLHICRVSHPHGATVLAAVSLASGGEAALRLHSRDKELSPSSRERIFRSS